MIDIKPGVLEYWFKKFTKEQVKSYIKKLRTIHEQKIENLTE